MTLTAVSTRPPLDTDCPTARIGPNAVIRLAEALRAVEGPGPTNRLFRSCELEQYLDHPPDRMVDEQEVTALYRALHVAVGNDRARTIGWIAGQRTAGYLLRHRIPRAGGLAIQWLPSRAGARVLATVIARHAWTFAGSGHLTVRHGRPLEFSIAGCPLCRGAVSNQPYCDFYAATFECLFAVLVHPDARAIETACQATGATACTFAIRW